MGVRRRPILKEDLYIVCEGISDKVFLDKFIETYNDVYGVKYNIKVHTSNSKDNLVRKYINIKKVFPDTNVLIFVDLDAKNNENIEKINEELNNRGLRLNNEEDIFFVNPVIEYLFILIKEYKNKKLLNKADYKQDIRKLFNIDNYTASEQQSIRIMKELTNQKLVFFLANINKCSSTLTDLPSTNIKYLVDYIKKSN